METEEIDYSSYKDKAPTDLQERFPDWIMDKTGYDPASAKTKDAAFREGVRLATALRMPFQASPENREATAARRRERAAQAAVPAAEPESAPAARKPAKAPAAKAAKAAATTAPPTKATGRGRRGARAATTASTSDSPF